MKYQSWAPADVVKLHRGYVSEFNAFSADEFEKTELDKHAQNMGFAHWIDFEKASTLKIEAIKRLLTRPEMESFWSWLGDGIEMPHSARGGIIGTLTGAIDKWYKINKKPVSDRNGEIRDIAKHAKALSRLLAKYRGEYQSFNNFGGLIPREYDQKLELLLHPELIERLKKMHYGVRPAWNKILPPIDEFLSNLAAAALDSDPKPLGKYPRKMKALNAFRTHLVDTMVSWFYRMKPDPAPTMMATFLSVALDDASITIGTITHCEANKEIKQFMEDYG